MRKTLVCLTLLDGMPAYFFAVCFRDNAETSTTSVASCQLLSEYIRIYTCHQFGVHFQVTTSGLPLVGWPPRFIIFWINSVIYNTMQQNTSLKNFLNQSALVTFVPENNWIRRASSLYERIGSTCTANENLVEECIDQPTRTQPFMRKHESILCSLNKFIIHQWLSEIK